MTQQNIFQEIETLHSQWSLGEKVGRLAFLKGEWNRLNMLAGQLALYFKRKGGTTQEERKSAEHLLEMIYSVETEGQQLQREVSNDAFKELIKILMR